MTGQEHKHRGARSFAWGLGLAVVAAATTPAWATFGYFCEVMACNRKASPGQPLLIPKTASPSRPIRHRYSRSAIGSTSAQICSFRIAAHPSSATAPGRPIL